MLRAVVIGSHACEPPSREEHEMSQTEYREPSGWATGAVLFAGILMIIIGIFEAFNGLNAIFEDQFYAVTENYIFDIDVTAWGWIHLLLGILVIFGGYAVMAGRTWGRILALIMATLAAIANFVYIPYYPFWSILMIALAIWVIWALTARWHEVSG
jgi:hypothetical protein